MEQFNPDTNSVRARETSVAEGGGRLVSGFKPVEPIRLNIRKIVELALRSGDIDNRFVESDVMQKGAKAHRKLQKSMGENYKSEVPLSMEAEIAGIPVLLSGRADGVLTHDDGSVTIDEIKTTTLGLPQLSAQRARHEGQAKCYAMMLCSKMPVKPPKITVQLTYYQLETGELERFHIDYSLDDIINFFSGLLKEYGRFLRFELEWAEIRNKSAREMAFPFDGYRKGQREMAVAAYRAIEKGKKLYAQAPTGIGKTLASLFPAVKAAGEGKAGRLFYLTAKTVTRVVAEDAMRLMMTSRLRFKTVSLRAKEKICKNDYINCNPIHCKYAQGHYDRINEALLDIIQNNDLITPEVILKYSGEYRVCPFETALDLTLWADLIICDYNHVFDPVVYLKRFFSEPGGNYVFLIDEAHNLADRVRDMYTAALKKSELSALKSVLKDKSKAAAGVRRCITGVNKRLSALREDLQGGRDMASDAQDTELAAAVNKLTEACAEWLAEERNSQHPAQEELLAVYFGALEFLNISELFDEHYAAITEAFGRDVKYTLFCLDPSEVIGKRLSLAKSSVLFSATLTPLPYHREILGGGGGDGMIALNSPFDSKKLLLIAHRGVSTKYADRPASLRPVAEAIYAAVSKKRGNYMVYFPSFEYLNQVLEVFAEQFPDIATTIQDRQMDEDSRASFLASFDAENMETLVGFCVMGGIFSEGIDLKGERLIGSIIVGVGLPKISLRQDLIRDYFDKTNGGGYDYAYVFPGMNKVMQAAGRVIRSEDDYGFVLLIDSRFGTAKYKAMYPEFWSHMRMINTEQELKKAMEDFK